MHKGNKLFNKIRAFKIAARLVPRTGGRGWGELGLGEVGAGGRSGLGGGRGWGGRVEVHKTGGHVSQRFFGTSFFPILF